MKCLANGHEMQTGAKKTTTRQPETPGSLQAKGKNPNGAKAQAGNGNTRGNFQKKASSPANEKSKRAAQQVGVLD